ncbi:hypothetical protein E2320_009619, partial [Naja naja]
MSSERPAKNPDIRIFCTEASLCTNLTFILNIHIDISLEHSLRRKSSGHLTGKVFSAWQPGTSRKPVGGEMGCDGGTIPKRHELVKGPRKMEKVDKNAELVAQWYYCTLSQEKLSRPIVACELGRLYNKDAVIEFLLDKSSDKVLVEAASHIKSIK